MSKLHYDVSLKEKLDEEKYTDYHFKSHSLIYSSLDLTSLMMDIFALMLTEMSENDWYDKEEKSITPEYHFNIKQLTEWFDVESKHLSSFLKRSCEKLSKKTIGIEGDDKWAYFPILSEVSYKSGVLTIIPNSRIRDIYIINSSKSGFGKIDNTVFKSIGNPNSKRVFEFLCRYKNDKEMYYLSVYKLQIMFSVRDGKGGVLKKSYINERTFINRVIKPALIEISTNEQALEKLELQTDKNGNIGYTLEDMANGKQKIRFLVRWKYDFSEEEKEEKYSQLDTFMDMLEQHGSTMGSEHHALRLLNEIQPLLLDLELFTEAENVKYQIEQLTKSMAIKDKIQKEPVEDKRKQVSNRLNLLMNKK